MPMVLRALFKEKCTTRWISKNEIQKRASNGDTLFNWLIGARNEKGLSMGANNVNDRREIVSLLLSSASSTTFLDTSSEGGSNL